jgi:hypothetical protein
MPTRCQQEVDVARPAKPRFVTEEPCVDFFKPRGIPLRELEEERLSVEELEALKLADIECLYQSCGHSWAEPFTSGARACETVCPECGKLTVRRACSRRANVKSGNSSPGCCEKKAPLVQRKPIGLQASSDTEQQNNR